MENPQTKYAQLGELHVAYATLGTGTDLVWVPNWCSNVEMLVEAAPLAAFVRRLAAFLRFTWFDQLGTGLSDPVALETLANLERFTDTTGAVLDALGADRAFLFAQDLGGLPAMLYAASHPERVAGLILTGCFARMGRAGDYSWGVPPATLEKGTHLGRAAWGTGRAQQVFAPSLRWDAAEFEMWGRFERSAASPGAFAAFLTMANTADIRDVLGAIQCPTLVIHRIGDRYIRAGNGRYLAEHIPNATYVELDGDDHYPFAGDTEPIVREIRNFVTPGVGEIEGTDRVLATVLFTDIVSSTEEAARLGDKRWREVLDEHDAIVRDAIRRHDGREVKATGDGFLATFDGPGRAIRCAKFIVERAPRVGIHVRAGLHTGEVEVRGSDVGGIAVHIGARVSALAEADEVLVSGTVRDLVVGSGFDFQDRGARELKGVPGEWRIFALSRETD